MSAALQVADSPYFGMKTAEILKGNPAQGMPKWDSRHAHRHAIRIMQQAGMFEELDQDRRDGVTYIADWKAKKSKWARRDAGLSLAFARGLEYIIRSPYEVEYPEFRATDFIPLMGGIPAAANSFTYRMLDKMGVAAIISDNANDAPKVDIKGMEWQQPIVTIGCSYDYTVLDTMRAAMLDIPLETYKAEAARFANEFLLEQLACVGNANAGLVGLINAPGVAATTQVSTGSWITQLNSIGAASTTNATPPAVVVAQNIGVDLGAMVSSIFTNTNGIYTPDTCLIPTAAYIKLKTTPQSPGYMGTNLLDYLEGISGLTIECWPQLNNTHSAVNGVTGTVVVYKKDPQVLGLVVPMQHTQLPPQAVKMAWEVSTFMRTGAVQVRRPLAVTTMIGVA